MAGRRFPKFSENCMKFFDGQLREINFQIAISSVKQFAELDLYCHVNRDNRCKTK
ncbi:hypothetical protein T03_5929 [Trichinella britovi]|uniref:Uncharacterized protein n=1 Tax=Trichinella britovi TaxID=45882 RepID=A0A0V0YXM6_TRIBR|nr:hypothetical protein T03_5929 [Trichinella britovi]